jgi:succinoglycan biosynthesis protein ExoM
MASTPPRHVTVAVPTYRRPDALAALLPELVAQAAALADRYRVRLLVVDNDPAGGGLATVRATAPGADAVLEPRPGVSAVRNRALDEAAGSDLLVFIDDDELPGPGWLAALLGAWEEWRCAAVTGPVRPLFTGPVDAWVLGSGVFERVRRPTGARLRGGATNNLLLDLARVRALGLRFDEALGLTGGEDTLFTHSLVRAGAEVRWCDEAEVCEPVAADRLTRGWVRRRSFRAGSSWSRAEVQLAGSAVARARLRAVLVARAAVRGAAAAAGLLAAAARRDAAGRGHAAATLASYAGLLTGAFGYVWGEYARNPEPPTSPALPGREEPSRVGV